MSLNIHNLIRIPKLNFIASMKNNFMQQFITHQKFCQIMKNEANLYLIIDLNTYFKQVYAIFIKCSTNYNYIRHPK